MRPSSVTWKCPLFRSYFNKPLRSMGKQTTKIENKYLLFENELRMQDFFKVWHFLEKTRKSSQTLGISFLIFLGGNRTFLKKSIFCHNQKNFSNKRLSLMKDIFLKKVTFLGYEGGFSQKKTFIQKKILRK